MLNGFLVKTNVQVTPRGQTVITPNNKLKHYLLLFRFSFWRGNYLTELNGFKTYRFFFFFFLIRPLKIRRWKNETGHTPNWPHLFLQWYCGDFEDAIIGWFWLCLCSLSKHGRSFHGRSGGYCSQHPPLPLSTSLTFGAQGNLFQSPLFKSSHGIGWKWLSRWVLIFP